MCLYKAWSKLKNNNMKIEQENDLFQYNRQN